MCADAFAAQCRSVGGEMRLFEAGSVRCYRQWYQLLSFALLPLLLAVPMLGWLIVAKELHTGVRATLTAGYRESRLFYSSVLLVRRFLIAAVVTFLAQVSPVASSVAASAVIVLSLLLHAALVPFEFELCNRVESGLLGLQTVLALLAGMDATSLADGARPNEQLAGVQAALILLGVAMAVGTMFYAERGRIGRILRCECREQPGKGLDFDLPRSVSSPRRTRSVQNASGDTFRSPLLDDY